MASIFIRSFPRETRHDIFSHPDRSEAEWRACPELVEEDLVFYTLDLFLTCEVIAGTLLPRIRPLLIPTAQQKSPVALRIPLVSKHGHSVGERLQKLPAVAVLHFLCTRSRRWRGLPLVDLRGNRNPGHNLLVRCRSF